MIQLLSNPTTYRVIYKVVWTKFSIKEEHYLSLFIIYDIYVQSRKMTVLFKTIRKVHDQDMPTGLVHVKFVVAYLKK